MEVNDNEEEKDDNDVVRTENNLDKAVWRQPGNLCPSRSVVSLYSLYNLQCSCHVHVQVEAQVQSLQSTNNVVVHGQC